MLRVLPMFKSLSVSAAAVLGACTVSGLIAFTHNVQAFASDTEAKSDDIHWDYAGTEGPEYWGELAQEYAACSTGTQQSPIDLQTTVDANLSELEFNYRATPLSIVNNGHTIQVNYGPGSHLKLDGQTYELLQFHFHDPSEHSVDGARHPMEAHLVHQNPATGDLAVVAIFLEIGDEHSALESIWDNMPLEAGPTITVADTHINVAELLPQDTQNHYRYFGSLTTPPCSEVVNWIVMKEPVEVSFEQVLHFAATVGENARPVQAQGHRFVLD